MKQVVILSGKGGTGKTSVVASLPPLHDCAGSAAPSLKGCHASGL